MADNIAEQLFGDKPEPTAASPATPIPEPTPVATPAIATPAAEPIKPVTVEPPKPEPGFVPIAAVLDEREKRRKAEERATALEAQRQQPQQIPSVQDDPEAFAAYVFEQTQRAQTGARFEISETIATEKHGADAVKAAMDWGMERAQASPAFAAEYMRQKHPIDWAVRQHKREQLISEMGDDPDAWVRQRYAQLNLPPAAPQGNGSQPAPAAPQPVAQSRPATPSPSLASAPSAGGIQTPVFQPNPVEKRLFGEG